MIYSDLFYMKLPQFYDSNCEFDGLTRFYFDFFRVLFLLIFIILLFDIELNFIIYFNLRFFSWLWVWKVTLKARLSISFCFSIGMVYFGFGEFWRTVSRLYYLHTHTHIYFKILIQQT